MLEKYLDKVEFENYDDFLANFKINVPENFNFGYDIIDEWARISPNKKALLWTNDQGQEIQFTFDAAGGRVDLTRITAVYGDRVGALPRPERRGYVFDGWYRDEACTQVYDFSAIVEGDLTLYAKWSEASAEVGGCGGCQSTLSAWHAMLALVAVGGVIARKRHED